MTQLFVYVCVFSDGGAPGGHGEGEAGAGVDESQAGLHPAVSVWERGTPYNPASWAQETPGGGVGDEVSNTHTHAQLDVVYLDILIASFIM